MKKIISLLVVILFCGSIVFSQEALKSTEEEYYDFLSLQGLVTRPTLGYRTLSDSVWNFTNEEAKENHVWSENNLGTTWTFWESEDQGGNWFTRGFFHGFKMKIFGPEWFNSYNTASPYGQNDGALWQGKGYNSSVSSGVRIEGYGFELTLKPQVSFSENREFEYMPSVHKSEFGYFCDGIDLPQRFGNSSFWTFDLGDSEIRWTWNTFTLGFGTQNPWLGKSWLNPMLGSNNAPSYPKIDIGMRKTTLLIPYFDIPLGDVEGRIWYGRLTESDYFDNDDTNDYTFVGGFNASFSPAFIPEFTIGATKICIANWKFVDAQYLNPFHSSNTAVGDASGKVDDQKASIYASWLFPTVGFEIYGELGIDDYSYYKKENPFHTMIYSLGLQQQISLGEFLTSKNIHSELILEWNNFEISQDFQLQWPYGGYYVHSQVKHGYTNKGQLLGAGSGEFGNSQY